MSFTTNRARQASRITWIGIAWNIVLTLFKFTAGIVANSSALIADAIHSLSDFASDMAVLTGLRIADRPVDNDHHYGHGKFETLSSIFISIALFVVGIALLWNGLKAVYQSLDGQFPATPGYLALGGAFLSIIIKEGLYQYTMKAGKSLNSQALIANAWHHRTDSYSSIAVLFGLIGAIFLGENWTILDPIAAIIVSLLIISFAISSLKESLNELMEASLDEELNEKILKTVNEVAGVHYPHNLKTRKIGNNIAIDMHIKVEPSLNIVQAHDIATRVESMLKESFGEDTFLSIHVEPRPQENAT